MDIQLKKGMLDVCVLAVLRREEAALKIIKQVVQTVGTAKGNQTIHNKNSFRTSLGRPCVRFQVLLKFVFSIARDYEHFSQRVCLNCKY